MKCPCASLFFADEDATGSRAHQVAALSALKLDAVLTARSYQDASRNIEVPMVR